MRTPDRARRPSTPERADVEAADSPARRGTVLLVAGLAVLLMPRTDRFGYPEVPGLVGLGFLAYGSVRARRMVL